MIGTKNLSILSSKKYKYKCDNVSNDYNEYYI